MKSELIVYNGIKFRRYPDSPKRAHRAYYRPGKADAIRGIQALHQEIWKNVYGPIPPGCDIHHKDHDTLNNAPENLVCMSRSEHHRHHMAGKLLTEKQRLHLEQIRPLAAAWHRSEEGRAWHKAHGVATWAQREALSKTCAFCQQPFASMARRDNNRFCSTLCQERNRSKEGRQWHTPKVCAYCQQPFAATKKKARYCSYQCSIMGRFHQ